MSNKNFTVLVNTSDGFEDCWDPFFKLFTLFWEEIGGSIILNTEFKNYTYPNLSIICAKSHIKEKSRKLTWSECLINALQQVETPLVLYVQEDYFFDQKVNHCLIEEMAARMLADNSIKYIGLTDSGNKPPFYKWGEDDRLVKVSHKSKYRISTQAALWRKETMLSYLKPHENGWMFEIFGTQRAKKRNDLFLTLNRKMYNYHTNPVISYIHTGIIKGKWHQEIPNIFLKNGIEIDFSKRGFYKPKYWIIRKMETAGKLLKNPLVFIRGMLDK